MDSDKGVTPVKLKQWNYLGKTVDFLSENDKCRFENDKCRFINWCKLCRSSAAIEKQGAVS